jgi:Ca2+-transporting ATPase
VLEARLAAQPLVTRVQASTLTGRVLVHFEASFEHAEVARWVVAAAGEAGTARPTGAGERRGWRLPRLSLPHISLGSLFAGGPDRPPLRSEGVQAQVSRLWYTLEPDEVLAQLGTCAESGLTHESAAGRLAAHGPNALRRAAARSDLAIFAGQFLTLPVGLLGISAVVSLLTGGLVDAAAIGVVVLINSVVGYVTERQAERTINALSETGPRSAVLIRGGRTLEVSAEAVVPGDVLILSPGAHMPACWRPSA